MALKNVSQSQSTAIPPRAEPLADAALEAADAMADLRCIADLLQWIENARHITSFVEFLVNDDKAFAQRLTGNGVAGCGAMWESNESDALAWLISQQHQIATTAERLLRAKVKEARSVAVSRAGEPQHG